MTTAVVTPVSPSSLSSPRPKSPRVSPARHTRTSSSESSSVVMKSFKPRLVPVPLPSPWVTVCYLPLSSSSHGILIFSLCAAGAIFVNSLIRGMNGEKNVVEPTFVKSPLYESEGVEYFSSNVELGVRTGERLIWQRPKPY
jgi:hypothetical protein